MNLYKANFDNEESMSKVNPVGTGSFSMNRKAETIVGSNSATVGFDNTAQGDNSFAEGDHTKALSESQHVQGKYNVEDTENKYAHVVGNGESDTARSNAHTLDWEGNAWYAGDVKATDAEGNEVSLLGMSNQTIIAINDAAMSKNIAGVDIHIEGSANTPFVGMNIYGRSTQEGVPSVVAPIDIVGIENPQIQISDGNIETAQTLSLTRSLNGLITDWGGNYTDSEGRLWIADEIDFARGVYIQRVYKMTIDGSQAISDDTAFDAAADVNSTGAAITLPYNSNGKGLCSFAVNAEAPISANTFKISGNTFRFRMSTDDVTDAALTTEWFTNNPQTLIFDLEVPIETELTSEELKAYKALFTYNPVTDISNSAGMYMAVDYVTQNYEKAVKLMMAGDYLSPGDVVNNLTSTATNLPLSANMGKSLSTTISGLPAKIYKPNYIWHYYDKFTKSTSSNLTIEYPSRMPGYAVNYVYITLEVSYSHSTGTKVFANEWEFDLTDYSSSDSHNNTWTFSIGSAKVKVAATRTKYNMVITSLQYASSSTASFSNIAGTFRLYYKEVPYGV